MIHYRVQHAPGREQSLARLLTGLPAETEVITDLGGEPPNPWRGYQLCLAPSPGTHLCVLQDDTVVCPNFALAVERIIASQPGAVVCLFFPGAAKATARAYQQAVASDQRYTRLSIRDFMPVVATIWPVQLAAGFLAWAATAQLPGMPRHTVRSDDAVAGMWHRVTRSTVLVTNPSLVEHPDDVESTVGLRAQAGKDRGRVAVRWIGDSDPLELDW